MSGNGKGSFIEIVTGIFKTSVFSLRNFYVPMITASVLFIMLAPGISFLWLGKDLIKSNISKPFALWHLFLFVIAYSLMAVFFSVIFRTWPGSQHAFGTLKSN
jgi:hypothetical protein